MDTSNLLHCMEVKNTHSVLVKRILAILGLAFFLMSKTTYVYSGTIYEESEYPIVFPEIRILSEILAKAEAEVNAREQSELETEKTQVSQIESSSLMQPEKVENALAQPSKIEDALAQLAKIEDTLVQLAKAEDAVEHQPVKEENASAQPVKEENASAQPVKEETASVPAKVEDTSIVSNDSVVAMPTLKNTKSTDDFYPQQPPKRITANLKFKGSDEERKVSVLFSKNYFKLINNPLNIVNLRAGLRIVKMSHDKGKDIEDVLLAGIDGIELCTINNITCESIRVAEHSDLMFFYQENDLTVSINFFGAN